MQDTEFEFYRYPGPRPFHDSYMDRRLFFGRDREKLELLQMVLANTLVVLHGPGGTGKTSLIHAGIGQELRLRNFVPVTIRYAPHGPDMIPLIFKRIAAAAAQHHLYHDPGEDASLWQYFKTLALHASDNTPLSPFLMLDQFEDFLRFATREYRLMFFRQLADLVNNTIPSSLRESLKPGTPFLYNMIPPGVKILIALQEDSLSHLEDEARDFPGLLANRLALAGLNREQARQTIINPITLEDDTLDPSPFQYAPDTVDMMLNFLCVPKEGSGFTVIDEAEPFLMQLLCRGIEEKARGMALKGKTGFILQPEDLGGENGLKKLSQGFYDRQLQRLGSGPKRRAARRLCEKGLLRGGRRVWLSQDRIEDKTNPPSDLLPGLAAAGLIQTVTNGGDTSYELGHDKLVPFIKASSRKNRIRHITALSIIIIAIVGFLYVMGVSDTVAPARTRSAARKAALAEYMKYGNIYMRRGEYAEAERLFIKGAELGPGYGPVHNALGIARVKQGKYSEAMASYRKALELIPQFNSARANLAEAELITEDFAAAYLYAQEVLKQPSIHPDLNLAMRFVSIAALLYQEKEQEAETHLQSFLTFYKGLPSRFAKVWNYGDIDRLHPIRKQLPSGQMQVLLRLIEILQSPRKVDHVKIRELETLTKKVFGNIKKAPPRGGGAV